MKIINVKILSTIVTVAVVASIGGVLLGYALRTKVPIPATDNSGNAPQKYASPEFKFEVEYPEGWYVDDNCGDNSWRVIAFGLEPNMIICYSDAPAGGPITINAYPKDNQLAQNIRSTKDYLSDAEEEQVNVGGEIGVKISGIIKPHEGPGPEAGLPMTVVFINRGSYSYRIVYIPIDGEDYTEELEAMIRSFRFI